MEVSVFRNLSAIRFIRCAVQIPGSDLYAGGAGFTLGEAFSKCDSERIERQFELHELRPSGVYPHGIAAHRNTDFARARALQEATETFVVRQIHAEGIMRCLWYLKIGAFALGFSRTDRGYFCFILGKLASRRIAAHSAGKSILGVLLKTWEEYQSFRFFKPFGEALKNYTKANHLFSERELKELEFRFEPGFAYQSRLACLSVAEASRQGRKIVYVYEPKRGNL